MCFTYIPPSERGGNEDANIVKVALISLNTKVKKLGVVTVVQLHTRFTNVSKSEDSNKKSPFCKLTWTDKT